MMPGIGSLIMYLRSEIGEKLVSALSVSTRSLSTALRHSVLRPRTGVSSQSNPDLCPMDEVRDLSPADRNLTSEHLKPTEKTISLRFHTPRP